MIGHYHLCSVGNHQMRCRYAPLYQLVDLVKYFWNIQCNTVADDVGNMAVEHARRQCVKRKFAVIVDNRMSGICTALKTDDNIRFLRKHICNLAFSFIAPVCTYYCFNHFSSHSAAKSGIPLCALFHQRICHLTDLV